MQNRTDLGHGFNGGVVANLKGRTWVAGETYEVILPTKDGVIERAYFYVKVGASSAGTIQMDFMGETIIDPTTVDTSGDVHLGNVNDIKDRATDGVETVKITIADEDITDGEILVCLNYTEPCVRHTEYLDYKRD